MTVHQPIQATIKGNTVTMQRAEFERLVALLEDAEDVAAFDAAQRRLASGDDELVPAAVADRLLAGESPVRVWRDHRGLTGKALAIQAGISGPYLAQIEAGQREPSLAVLKALAAALRVGLDDLA